tara:strand:- start:217886 stop:218344 length:459 start_codon:yes stop_codon:yes gene_type:complete
MKYLLLTISILLQLPAFSSQYCQELLDDCEYYTCINQEKNCGSSSYFLKFGKKYCNKFAEHEEEFSRDGQDWIKRTKVCLIDSIDKIEDGISCNQYKREAISHHIPCYLDSGYCDLSNYDRAIVTKTILKSLWRPSMISAGIRVLTSCAFNK